MTATDVDAVERLAAQAAPEAAVWKRPQLLELLAIPSHYDAWVAEEAGAVVGFVWCHVIGGNLPGGEAELDNLAVDPAWRHQGIASQLLETAWQRAVERGAHAMFLEVRSANTAAQRLYQRAGFTVYQRRPSYYSRPTDDALLMVRRLPPGEGIPPQPSGSAKAAPRG